MTDPDESAFISEWKVDIETAYRLASSLFSGKGSAKAKLAYAQKLKLLALAKQVSVGPYQPERASEVGLLDVVGNDRLYFFCLLQTNFYFSFT